jgi:AcrR family transcriptional regulator
MDSASTAGRKRLEPDPRVRAVILTASARIIRAEGVPALSVAAVLERTKLGTRAFYRHFDSKDQLLAAVFLDMARREVRRLRKPMEQAPDPVRAVMAWIDGRLDLVFDDRIRPDLRRVSLEAQSQMFATPELVAPAYREMLRPLIEYLERGKDLGLFDDIDPDSEGRSINGVVWANVQSQWAMGDGDLTELRTRVQRFCLRGLGVAAETIDVALAEASRPELLKDNATR